MAWLRLDDNLDTDPIILNVSRNFGEATKVLGWITRLMLYSARHLSDGFLPEVVFRDVVRSRVWREKLTTPPGGGTSLVHLRGDACPCLKDRPWPDTAADVYVHHYLSSNPSRDEYDVQRAKQAELRDSELRAAVRQRDRSRCRYCGVAVVWADRRSSTGGVVDHVDPRQAAGAANLVVACRGCNSRKGNRTPDAAGMTLLPAPGTNPRHGNGSDPGRTQLVGTDTSTRGPVRDGTGRATDYGPGDAGPAGDRPTTGPPTTTRTSTHPNPYHRTAITGLDPPDHAGLPSATDHEYADTFGESGEFP
jgi:5-methylcytosine-specific restriction endonuclease McrA